MLRVSWGVGVAPQSSLGSRGLFIEGELGSAEQIHAARAPISRNTQLLWTLAALLSGQGDGSLQQELMLIYVRGWKCSWEDKTQLVAIDCAHHILGKTRAPGTTPTSLLPGHSTRGGSA